MTFEHRFLKILSGRIADDLTRLHQELGSGVAIVADDPAASGMKVARHVGKIAGLKAALVHIEETEAEMSQKPKREG